MSSSSRASVSRSSDVRVQVFTRYTVPYLNTYNNIQSDDSTQQLVQPLLRTAKPLLRTDTNKQPTNGNITTDNNEELDGAQGSAKPDSGVNDRNMTNKSINKKKRKRDYKNNRGDKKKKKRHKRGVNTRN